MMSCLPAGASIGLNNDTSSEYNYIIKGNGKDFCDGIEEILTIGTCQYCPKVRHILYINTGNEELILFTVVAEK